MDVSKLAKNIGKTNKITKLDIVLEGGCMNGAYEIGGLLLIKELEKRNNIKVSRISGSSVGSFVGFLYLTNNLQAYIERYQEMKDDFHKSTQLKKLKQILNDIIKNVDEDIFETIKDNKLYIKYYDVENKKSVLKSHYKTKAEIVNTILKSCHIPYLINGNPYFIEEGREYIDGGMPFIFKPKKLPTNRVLYMKLTQFNKLPGMFNIKNEEIIEGRILEGLLDTYNFFLKKKETWMCSYVENWGVISTARYNFFSLIYWVIVCLFIKIRTFILLISPKFVNTSFYHHFKPTLIKLYKDMIRYIVFK
jgi:hypothetical protein